VVARFDDGVIARGSFRMGPISVEIGWAERIGLVGPNGSGKTTFVDALLGRLPLESGAVWLGPSVVVGELGQDRRVSADEDPTVDDPEIDDPEIDDPTVDDPTVDDRKADRESVLDRVMGRCGLTVSEARSLLAKFGLGAEHVDRRRGLLSPGERTRAELAIFQARKVNFLVLDEPTNHLDVPAVEQIEEALSGFGGTVLLVSHDRRLLDAVDLTRCIDLGRYAETGKL
jgi:ATPase subunit of ABC transporter with duplicated ATPase domains